MTHQTSKVRQVRKEEVASQIAKELYKDSQDDACYTCDLIIKAGPERCEFYCHRIILAASSDFLWAALATAVPGTLPVLVLPDIESVIMKYILCYVYNGQLLVPLDKYEDFIEGCHLMGLKGLGDKVIGDETEEEEDEEIPLEGVDFEEKNDEDEMEVENNEKYQEKSEDTNTESAVKHVKTKKIPKDNQKLSKRNIQTPPEAKHHQEHLERIKNIIRSVYLRTDKDFGIQLEAKVKKTKLVMEGNKLLNAEHICGLCGRVLRINYNWYRNTVNWKNESFVYHLKAKHMLKYTPARNNHKKK